jgi:hypothetical protein
MPNRERRKGRAGEAEAATVWGERGFEVQALQRNLYGQLDHIVSGYGTTLVQEVKRTETARPWAWIAQAAEDAPLGVPYVVTFRRSRADWHSIIRTSVLAQLLTGLGYPPPPVELVESDTGGEGG